MATTVINTIFQLKRGVAEAWKRNNPILQAGEPGWTLDTHVLKIGDGHTAWNDLPSNNSSSGNNSSAIIDVIELPTENINKSAIYRMKHAICIGNGEDITQYGYICHYINGLPEVGVPVSDADGTHFVCYYNEQDGIVSGYIDDVLSEIVEIPAGWYDIATIFEPAGWPPFGGVITDISEDPCDDALRVLVSTDYYTYENGWCQLAMPREKLGEKIEWDGVIGDKHSVWPEEENPAYCFVKVSDNIYSLEDLIDGVVKFIYPGGVDVYSIEDDGWSEYETPGAIIVNSDVLIVYDADTFNSFSEAPEGLGFQNGVYFYLEEYEGERGYTSCLQLSSKVIPIDSKFLPDMSSVGISWNNLTDKPFDETISLNREASGVTTLSSAATVLDFQGNMNFLVMVGREYVLKAINTSTGECRETIAVMEYTYSSGAYSYYIGNSTTSPELYGVSLLTLNNWQFYSSSPFSAGTWEVSIDYRDVSITPLDEKFIPDTIARKSDIPEVDTSWNDLTDKPFDEKIEMKLLTSGMQALSEPSTGFTTSTIYFRPEVGVEYILRVANPVASEVREVTVVGEQTTLSGITTYKLGNSTTSPELYGSSMGGYNWFFYTNNSFPAGTWNISIMQRIVDITCLDEKFIPDTIARTANISYEKLPDRPFYEDRTDYVDNVTLIYMDVNSNLQSITSPTFSTALDTLCVLFDGVEYTSKRFTYMENTMRYYVWGNSEHWKPGYVSIGYPDLPFCIVVNEAAPQQLSIYDDRERIMGARTHTISIYTHTLKKIDSKFLPDDIPAGSGGAAIIDVIELPTENINEQAIYRVFKAQFAANGRMYPEQICHCVASLPEVGEVVTDAYMSFIVAYYNMTDNEVYGYVDEALGSVIGVSPGWLPFSVLASASGAAWGGVITDITEDSGDGTTYVLLSYHYYTYKDEWTRMVFATERAPKFDVKWDGVIGDKFSMDLTPFGFEGATLIKVSDEVPTEQQLIGATVYFYNSHQDSYGRYSIYEDDFSREEFPGALNIVGGAISVVYAADELCAAMGLPVGYISNGIYFTSQERDEGVEYTSHLVTTPRITPISLEYLPKGIETLVNIWNDGEIPTLARVHDMINEAIGNAIGGSY